MKDRKDVEKSIKEATLEKKSTFSLLKRKMAPLVCDSDGTPLDLVGYEGIVERLENEHWERLRKRADYRGHGTRLTTALCSNVFNRTLYDNSKGE